MKKIIFIFLAFHLNAKAQLADQLINTKETERLETYLSSDALKGRKTFSPEIEVAANFIAKEFLQNGLQFLPGLNSYTQNFEIIKAKFISASATINEKLIDSRNIIAITTNSALHINETMGYELIALGKTDKLQDEARRLLKNNKNYIVQVPTTFANNFGNLIRLKNGLYKSNSSVIFILTDELPVKYTMDIKHQIIEQKLSNVCGYLAGQKGNDEYVIFSAHYDHLGTGKPQNGDSIFNGANDDASGTTAVIELSKYFKQLKNNKRNIIFVAFTAEEIGGFGSNYFSTHSIPAQKIVAMFNIEMIGTESKWGLNSAYITGYDKSNFGEIINKALLKTTAKFYADPYPDQQLFYRSDNATLARLGVPAHTISTSKMDVEPNYHKVSDEISTLNLQNMTQIIKAIAVSAQTIINGATTPSRVNIEELK